MQNERGWRLFWTCPMAFLRMIRLGASLRAWTQSRGTACFLSWVQAINAVLPAKPLAIDGKTARRSHERAAGRDAIQMVSAWAAASHLVLGKPTRGRAFQ